MSQQRTVDARTLELQRPSSAAILASHVEPKDDIAAERRRATFSVDEVALLLNGSSEAIAKRCGKGVCWGAQGEVDDEDCVTLWAWSKGCALCWLQSPRRRERFAELLQRTSWGNKDNRYFLSREEEYEAGLRVAFGIW